jgi:hypothetical protein
MNHSYDILCAVYELLKQMMHRYLQHVAKAEPGFTKTARLLEAWSTFNNL